jgi:hypothetical protein
MVASGRVMLYLDDFKIIDLASSGSTVVEHTSHQPVVEGSSPAATLGPML